MRSAHTAVLVGLLCVGACGGEPISPGTSCRDLSVLRPTVTVGTSVVFHWEPACGVSLLFVQESGADEQWSVLTPEATWDDPDQANRIMPGVTYGQLPTGTSQLTPPTPLIPGKIYELVLWRVIPQETLGRCLQRLQQSCLAATREFTR
jgi:hypothetical protein